MKILLFKNEDLTSKGTFKKKNNSKTLSEAEFKAYIKENNVTLKRGYIDLIGFISNGFKFRCYYNGICIGVTNLIKECG